MGVPSIINETWSNDNGGPKSEVVSIQNDSAGFTIATVGVKGVTSIELYRENGQIEYVPWAAIYKGDFLAERVDLAGLRIVYKEPE